MHNIIKSVCPDEESLDPNTPGKHPLLPLLEGPGTISDHVCCFSPLWASLTALSSSESLLEC